METTSGVSLRNSFGGASNNWLEAFPLSCYQEGEILWLQRNRLSSRKLISHRAQSAQRTLQLPHQELFGHADGYELVKAPGANKVLELVSAILVNEYATAAYTAGGNTTINIGSGGVALSGLVSNANFIQASADKVIQFVPLAATFLTLTENAGINLVTASAPTNPGTAAGVFHYRVVYRIHTTQTQ